MGTETQSTPNEIDTNRGIQNTQSRFEARAKNRLLSEQLQKPSSRTESESEPESESESFKKEYQEIYEATKRKVLKSKIDSAQAILRSEGEDIDSSDIQILQETTIRKDTLPSFPYFIVAIAAIKDVLDVFITATVIGMVVTPVISFFCSLILFMWTLGKISGWMGRKKVLIAGAYRKLERVILVRYGLSIAIEIIPGVNVIPANTIFVLMAHYDETKIVKLINRVLDVLHHSEII